MLLSRNFMIFINFRFKFKISLSISLLTNKAYKCKILISIAMFSLPSRSHRRCVTERVRFKFDKFGSAILCEKRT